MIDKIIEATIMLSSLWGIIRYLEGYDEDPIVLPGGVYMFGIGAIIFFEGFNEIVGPFGGKVWW